MYDDIRRKLLNVFFAVVIVDLDPDPLKFMCALGRMHIRSADDQTVITCDTGKTAHADTADSYKKNALACRQVFHSFSHTILPKLCFTGKSLKNKDTLGKCEHNCPTIIPFFQR